jgi:DNA-binding response OmpR family regulator
MAKILVVDDEPLICQVVTDCLQDYDGIDVVCASDGKMGAQMLAGGHFALVLINGTLAEVSGIELAEIAANENTPALLLSGHPETNDKLKRFGYPYLAKPFTMNRLLAESRKVMAESRENIRQVKTAAAKKLASSEALKATVAKSNQLLDEAKG